MDATWWVDELQLDDEQSSIIDLPLGRNYLLFGPPGSGKTNLLLLRANFAYLAGSRNIQIVVFTRTLQEFIASGGAQYDFPVDKVSTSTKFEQDLLFEYGVHADLPEDFEGQREALVREVMKLADARRLAGVFDTIFLDEGHDYLPEEIEMFAKLGKNLFATADSRQKIYPGEDATGALSDACHEQRTLRYHYRIGRMICRVADALMRGSALYDPLEPNSQYDEQSSPSKVEVTACAGVGEQAERALDSLRLQLKAYPDELLGVVCPTRAVLDEVRQAIDGSDLAGVAAIQGDGAVSFDPGKRISVSTIHAAKGLEFRTLHILGADELKRFQYQRNMAFTAVTRAKTTLSVYHTRVLPGYLEDALQAALPPKPLPEIRRVFGGKGK